MNSQEIIHAITEELRRKHECHTVILYGSRARGKETEASDYDVMGVRASGETYRDARRWNGVYLDLFVYSESKIAEPDHSLLHMRNGVILCEKEGSGQRFLTKLNEIYAAGPKKLPADEIQALRVWAWKSLERVRAGGLLGNFRRAEMIPALLEHYFTTRGMWYPGPKQSLCWLEENQPAIHAAFNDALKPASHVSAIESLVRTLDLEAGAAD